MSTILDEAINLFHNFVSPTRQYAIIVDDEFNPGKKEIVYTIKLPHIYKNTPVAAKQYFPLDTSNLPFHKEGKILHCLPIEMYEEISDYLEYKIEKKKQLLKGEKEMAGKMVSYFDYYKKEKEMIEAKEKINKDVSPSRRYVIVYKDVGIPRHSDNEYLYELKYLSELYVNNVSGAIDWFKDKVGISKDRVISCVPYELHMEHVREQDEVSRHVLVSPSRSYVLFTKDQISDQEDIYLVTLPYQYGNDEIEASKYLYENRLPKPNITNCLIFEMYVKEKPGIRPLIGPIEGY